MKRTPIYIKQPVKKTKRKPIHIPHNRRCKFNPEFLDPEVLLNKFTPLMQSLHKYFCSYCGILDQQSDCDDLYAQIQYEFLRLCQNYDPRRGVDFTGYIQFNLRNRIYYYVCRLQKYQTTEQLLKQFEDVSLPVDMALFSQLQHVEDESAQQELDRVEALASIPWEHIEDELDRDIIHNVLVHHNSLENIAKVKNIALKVIKDRFNSLCERLTNLATPNMAM